jgi:hypothetical protein
MVFNGMKVAGTPFYPTAALVTAYGSDTNYCKIVNWGNNNSTSAIARFKCFTITGSAVDTLYVANWLTTQPGDWSQRAGPAIERRSPGSRPGTCHAESPMRWPTMPTPITATSTGYTSTGSFPPTRANTLCYWFNGSPVNSLYVDQFVTSPQSGHSTQSYVNE